MPLVKNTTTGNNYLVKVNTDGDACSRTAIRSYDKQVGAQGVNGNRRFYLPFNYSPSSHTLWVFVNGEKAVVEQTAQNASQYVELDGKTVQFGGSLNDADVLEFIVAGSYLNDEEVGGSGTGGLTWILTGDDGLNLTNNYGYLTDTSSGAITFYLPSDPAEGETFAVADAFGTFGTNNATLNRLNPLHKIQHLSQDFLFNKDGMAAQFVFDGIDNWLIVNDSGFLTEDNWITIATDFTAANSARYMVDTTAGVVTVQCPVSPIAGSSNFAISDYAGNFNTNNVIIQGGVNRIHGLIEDFHLNVGNITVRMTYIDATVGWKVVTIST